ncbi:hypothetical protein C2G38_2206437 [Gigaspora rosea]|uniref:Uncharacterized protein n=1 Tax=Gigaspora rosea TaxID=44941 RepID=A0A397UJC0_9GLOM|nr:hypothetical protein C2G38_2206437 [Gigaspora rosea]
MKNYRGAASQNVRHAIWRIFGSEKLPSLNSNASAPEIWVYWIDMIARSAFSTAAVPTMTPEHCAFTLADDLNGEGPSYKSAQAVMNDEAGNRFRPTSETDEPEPASQSSSLMNYSQDEINDLFGIDY